MEKNNPAPFKVEWEGKRRPLSLQKSKNPIASTALKAGLLIDGDNRDVAAALLPACRGKVRLIYADPPYGVGSHFHAGRRGGGARERAYHDPSGSDEVQALYDLLFLYRELLADDGTIWLQCDWRRNAVFRLLLDEIFGPERFLNHVIWSYKTGGISPGRRFARKHDDILVYAKGPKPYLKPNRQKSYVPTLPEPHTPSGKRLGVKRDVQCDLCGNGAPGQKFRWVIGRDVWDDIPALFRNDREIVGYDTQKPLALLRRIISCGTKKGDLVVDLFGGSGTTAVAAAELGRRWIVGDKSPVALRTINRRLAADAAVKFTTVVVK